MPGWQLAYFRQMWVRQCLWLPSRKRAGFSEIDLSPVHHILRFFQVQEPPRFITDYRKRLTIIIVNGSVSMSICKLVCVCVSFLPLL